MAGRQFTAPILIRGGDDVAPLTRIPGDELFKPESWLQQLLFDHPALIPVDDIEPVFSGMIPVVRELRMAAGRLDLLYVNPRGYLTLVETKLWRNPQARREVVGQIIDYATELSRWSYLDLVAAVRKIVGGAAADPLLELARAAGGPEFDEARFSDTLVRNLALGRFLLLIVGDGIHEGVEQMAEFLQQAPHLGFRLALVEMALFRLPEPSPGGPQPGGAEPGGPPGTLLVQPRVVVRTREVTRGVIELRVGAAAGAGPVATMVVAPPETRAAGAARGAGGGEPVRPTITQQDYFESLAAAAGPDVVAFVKRVLDEAPDHGLEVDDTGDAGPMLKYVDDHSGKFFTFGSLARIGLLGATDRLSRRCIELGLPPSVWQDYHAQLIKLVPGAYRHETQSKQQGKIEMLGYDGRIGLPLALLAPRKADWFTAIDQTIDRIDRAMENRVAMQGTQGVQNVPDSRRSGSGA